MNTMIKKWTALGVSLLFAGMIAGCGGNETMGYVDMQKITKESPKAQTMQQDLEKKRQEISTRLEGEKASLSDEEFMKKQQDAQREMQLFAEVQQKQFMSYMEAQMASVAKEKDLGIIVIKNAVHQGGVDVTDDVLAKMKQ